MWLVGLLGILLFVGVAVAEDSAPTPAPADPLAPAQSLLIDKKYAEKEADLLSI